jgi:hypothetical protein
MSNGGRLIVLCNATPGQEREFNDWYDQVHLLDVLKVDGVAAAQRFRISNNQSAHAGAPTWRYATIYELDQDRIAEIAASIAAKVGTAEMEMTNAIDGKGMFAFYFEPVGPRLTGHRND